MYNESWPSINQCSILIIMWRNYKKKEKKKPLFEVEGVQDIHDLYCKKFLVKQVHVNGKVETIVRGTSKLNTLEMHNFMESVKIDAATEFGITLPLPEDQHYLDFIHEYQNRY